MQAGRNDEDAGPVETEHPPARMKRPAEHLPSGGSPAARDSRVAAPDLLYVGRHLHPELGEVSRVELDEWCAVRRRHERERAIATELEGHTFSRSLYALALEVPAHEEAVALVAGVEGVIHLSVDILDVRDDLSSKPAQVEHGVAPDQRIEGPRDGGDTVLERPCSLVELEREAGAAPMTDRVDTCDVGVELDFGWRCRPRDRRADQLPVTVERPDDIVARYLKCPQYVSRDRRRATRLPPEVAEEGAGSSQLPELGQLAHRDPGSLCCCCRGLGSFGHAPDSTRGGRLNPRRPWYTLRAQTHPREGFMKVSLTVNGAARTDDVEPRLLLVHYLRDVVGLTGTNVGCDTSSCGACTIHVDGESVKSCTMLAVQAEGAAITTIEGLASNGDMHPMQEAFRTHHGLQCGYCTPGMVMAATSLLAENANPTEREVRDGLEGNLCRCTGYHNIVKAVLAAAES